MFHQYSRQQDIGVIEASTYTKLKYWDKLHSILLEAEKRQVNG